jgi:peptidoglycan/xylan/chitin deacetylase (PgdA/CDA1 family)
MIRSHTEKPIINQQRRMASPLSGVIKEPLKYLVFSVTAPLGRWFSIGGVPILTYHSLDESQSPISMGPSAFQRQMRYLKDHGFTTITLSGFIENLKSKEPFPGKAFVLTFDDGFKNVYRIAFSILSELDFTATIFLPTDYMDKAALWESKQKNKEAGVHRLPLLSWDQVEEMHRHGFSFGSHGARHMRLTQLDRVLIRKDVEKSKLTIEDKLGDSCQLFSYPYGDFDESVRRIVQETGFEGAVTIEFGRNNRSADPFALRRIGSAHFTSTPVFRACIYGTYGWHLRSKRKW